MGKLRVSMVGFTTGLVLLSGCATTIAYKPMAGTPPPADSTVALRVVDERPADHGGSDKKVVGKVRGSYGIPASVTDSNPNVVVDTVTQATTDALAQSGVGVGDGGHTLEATVKHFWMDGFTGYKGTVTVAYALRNGSGKSVWTKEISGASGGALVFKSAQSMTQDIFGAALSDFANKAATEFKSAEFQKALK